MHQTLRFLLATICCFVTGFTHAAPLATVEAVQAPAWFERAGRLLPLAPGAELKSGDIVLTGQDARAYLQLLDGSRVKLGESARFALHSHSTRPTEIFRGALDVVTGAFRFTTGVVNRVARRDLMIRVGTATIGIRGTDIWGRSSKERDVVALLVGRIEISRQGNSVEMTEPMTFLDAPRAGEAVIRSLEQGQLDLWARETEILPGDGAARPRGRWRITLASVNTREAALDHYDRLRAAGFDVRIRPYLAGDSSDWHYVLYLGGFSDRAEAAATSTRLARLGYTASVSR